MSNEVATQSKKELSVVGQVKGYLAQESVKNRFNEVLGNKANQYMASIVNTVAASKQLQECVPQTILSAAFVAASYDLPIDSNLGFAAIVPYKDYKTGITNAQFQMMYKGFVQLAIRSGQYENMNVSEVYEDELLEYNPITGELKLTNNFSECTQRKDGKRDKIVGYYAWFKLLTGFRKELFMTKDECVNHATQYSASYKLDLKKGWSASKWSTDFDAMAKKTVLKLLLSKWGVLSIDMQRAIQDDQKIYETEEGEYSDNKTILEDAPDVFSMEGGVADDTNK
jgi:recombination protein RecT